MRRRPKAAYEGGPAYTIQARLRYNLKESKLSLRYELVRVQRFLEIIGKEIAKTISEKTELPLFFGTP